MIGLGVLVALGRRFLAVTLADTGMLPASYYRHLALAALEEEDFPQALAWLPFAQDPLLTQLLVLRLRLLAAKHEEQRGAVQELLDLNPPEKLRDRGRALLEYENRALELLGRYEKNALDILRRGPGERDSPTLPSNFPPSPL
ncbi:MAG: hypothetical protein P8X65_00285 [Syntrophobacterales bacterium]|jgi:tetratricopeptide (TPR) repeat protein